MAPADISQSITRLIRDVEQGRASAVGSLLAVYFDRLVGPARTRVKGLPGMADLDEDVALRSFESLCRRVRDPSRPLHLEGRDDLWRLLATRTVSRAIDVIRRNRRGELADERDLEQLLS